MPGIGFSELLLIAVVALVVIGPKDLPVVIRHVAKFMHEFRGLYAGMKRQMHEVMEEAGVHDIHRNVTTIIDLKGTPQKAYDLSELTNFEKPKPPELP